MIDLQDTKSYFNCPCCNSSNFVKSIDSYEHVKLDETGEETTEVTNTRCDDYQFQCYDCYESFEDIMISCRIETNSTSIDCSISYESYYNLEYSLNSQYTNKYSLSKIPYDKKLKAITVYGNEENNYKNILKGL